MGMLFFGLAQSVLLLFALFAVPPLGVPPLPEDKTLLRAVPADALGFVQWFGVGQPDPKSANATERLAAEPEVRRALAMLESCVGAAIEKEEGGDGGRLLSRLCLGLYRLPCCVFVQRWPWKDGNDARIGIIVRTGATPGALHESLRELEQLATQHENAAVVEVPHGGVTIRRLPTRPEREPEVAWAQVGDHLVCGIGDGVTAATVDRLQGKPSLADQERFRTLQAQVALERPWLRCYLNSRALLAPLLLRPQVAQTCHALGLDGVEGLLVESGLHEGGFRSQALLATRGEPRGLLRIQSARGLTPKDHELVPADAQFAMLCRFDVGEFFRQIPAMMDQCESGSGKRFLAELQRGVEALGLHLDQEMVDCFGDTAAVYSTARDGAWFLHGLTLAVTLRDAPTLRKMHERLVEKAGNELVADEFGGTKVWWVNHRDDDVPFAPAWCITDSQFLIALWPQALRHALTPPVTPRPPLGLEPPRGGKEQVLCAARVDDGAVLRAGWPLLQMGVTMLFGKLQREGLPASIDAVPSLGTLLRYAEPQQLTLSRGEHGLVVRRHGRFPSLDPTLVFGGTVASLWWRVYAWEVVREVTPPVPGRR